MGEAKVGEVPYLLGERGDVVVGYRYPPLA